MGTSASSKGPGSGVAFDPPWLDDTGGFESSAPTSKPVDPLKKPDQKDTPLAQQIVTPPARFLQARTCMGKYATQKTGREGFQKAAGHYSKTGMGGASRLAHRMRHSTATGAKLAHFLTSTSSRQDVAVKAWVKDIMDRKLTGQNLIDAIVQQVAPSAGSREEESCADSMARALSEFLEKNPDAELLNLDVVNIREITERFLANEACHRLTNDVCQILESGKISLKESLTLLNEMREYLRADLSVQVINLWKSSANPSQSELNRVLKTAIQRTFEVYEGEI